MRIPGAVLFFVVGVSACSSGSAPALDDQPSIQDRVREERPGLLARATIDPDRARIIAVERAGGGTIEEVELEEEGDRLLYSFDIRLADGGVLEVEVDALNGEVISVGSEEDEHEDDGADDDEEGTGGR